MNILIIDNGSIHLTELQRFLAGHNTTTINKSELNTFGYDSQDLIVLSGSSSAPIVADHNNYKYEIELIKTSQLPIIGICMGFEVIAWTYGANLKEMKSEEIGILNIRITSNETIFNGIKTLRVAENHRWVVDKIKYPLVELAKSKDGIEIIRHATKDIYGFQFHPEITKIENQGQIIFNNLLEQFQNKLKV